MYSHICVSSHNRPQSFFVSVVTIVSLALTMMSMLLSTIICLLPSTNRFSAIRRVSHMYIKHTHTHTHSDMHTHTHSCYLSHTCPHTRTQHSQLIRRVNLNFDMSGSILKNSESVTRNYLIDLSLFTIFGRICEKG